MTIRIGHIAQEAEGAKAEGRSGGFPMNRETILLGVLWGQIFWRLRVFLSIR
jgi:hypothetical protein